MFSFDFIKDDNEESLEGHNSATPDIGGKSNVLPAESISIPLFAKTTALPHHEVVVGMDGDKKIVMKKCNLHFQSGIDKDFDIVSGLYEGGYKAWECCFDLVMYLAQSKILLSKTSSPSRSVLEIGCGVGFPGIYALQEGCRPVVFSDLNKEVLLNLTWPNIYLNCPEINFGDDRSLVQCFSGDWQHLSTHFDAIEQTKFDFILASETIYSFESCEKTFNIIERQLATKGEALIATKRFYFGAGLGGGTSQLEQTVKNKNSISISNSGDYTKEQWTMRVVRSFEDGQSNIRDIVSVIRNF